MVAGVFEFWLFGEPVVGVWVLAAVGGMMAVGFGSGFDFGFGSGGCSSAPQPTGVWVPEYRRLRVAGGCYFFTVCLADRGSDLLVREVGALRAAVRRVMAARPFVVDAWVVLPDHLHAVWTLPAEDADFSSRWSLIKRGFSLAVGGGERRSLSRVGKGERGVWQRRFWEHAIRDGRDYAAHVDYVHFNPVRHGLVSRVGDWPYSSFGRAVARGAYPAGWGDEGVGFEGEFGERR